MQSIRYYIGRFHRKIPKDAFLVTVDVVGLHLSISHEFGLKALEEALGKRESKKVSKLDLVKIATFLLQNNYFEFIGEPKEQIYGTAIDTNFLLYMHVYL